MLISFSATKEGGRLFTFNEVMVAIGLTATLFSFSWYLKNAFSDEILRLILLEVYLCSLSKANHVLIIEGLISERSDV